MTNTIGKDFGCPHDHLFYVTTVSVKTCKPRFCVILDLARPRISKASWWLYSSDTPPFYMSRNTDYRWPRLKCFRTATRDIATKPRPINIDLYLIASSEISPTQHRAHPSRLQRNKYAKAISAIARAPYPPFSFLILFHRLPVSFCACSLDAQVIRVCS